MAIVIGSNAGVIPFDAAVIIRALIASAGAAIALLWALRVFQRDLATRAIWLSWVFALSSIYGPLMSAVRRQGVLVETRAPGPASLYTLGVLVIATVATRPWQVRRRDPVPLVILATLLVAGNLSRGLIAMAASDESWHPAADRLTASSASHVAAHPRAATRDIYYIVLDGFGRADTLSEYYSLDLSSFVGFLRSRGFYVAEAAQSNYSQTFLSLGSALNLNYLDSIATATPEGNRDRRLMRYLIAHNALMKMARNAGYQVIGVGSDYMATKQLEAADVCICRPHGLDEIEQAAIGLTPLIALPLGRWPYDTHRDRVIAAFAELERLGGGPSPRFIFAHIVTPHPPFVFAADGSVRKAYIGNYIFNDGDYLHVTPDDYVAGYHDQVQFVTRRVQQLVTSLLDRPGPTPVIIFHGDHGPGSMLRWDSPKDTNMRERLSIFAAYRFPDGPGLYPTITPVNGARLLANGYLGAQLPLLPDRSWFSTFNRPYDFIPVGELTPQ